MENFIHAIVALESRAFNWHPIKTTHVSCGDMPNATFTEFSTSVVGPWASFGSDCKDEPERAGKPRLAYVLAVECASCNFYFIEIDRLRHEAGMHTRVAYRRDGKRISDTTLTKLMHLLYKARGGDAPTHECAATLLAAGLMDAAAAPMPACEFSGTEVRLPLLAQQRMTPPLPALVAKNLCREAGTMFFVAPVVCAGSVLAGLVLANHYDFPPGQIIAALLAALLLCGWAWRWFRLQFSA